MQTKKDMKEAKKENLQGNVTLSSDENLQSESTIPTIVQRNMQVELSTYNDALGQLKTDGVDKNILFQRFLELICEIEGFSYAVLRKNVSITTNNQQTNGSSQRTTNYSQRENQGLSTTDEKPSIST
ncbi:hypothetical protein V9L05_01485 [Bernardetia sp. Wsw4-3y2]|uniref:hypothetical protein n=1 Tax=Bernardetia sp. Wsw4-3y2 TaxID=3127471 RepID=UPI0030D0A5A8